MKKVFVILLSFCVLCLTVSAFAADPVDLTGKKGVVDPKDLKKSNPESPSLKINPPPPLPEKEKTPTEKIEKKLEQEREKIEERFETPETPVGAERGEAESNIMLASENWVFRQTRTRIIENKKWTWQTPCCLRPIEQYGGDSSHVHIDTLPRLWAEGY